METIFRDTHHPYENVVLNGGGTRGYAFIGAIHKLQELNILKGLRRFAGTSVGAIFATALSIGFSDAEIENIRTILDFSHVTSSCFYLADVYRVCNRFGINSLDPLDAQLRKIFQTKVDPEITLEELFDMTGKELVIVTCCPNRENPVYLHHAQFPEVHLVDALISSISVPIIFQPRHQNFMGDMDYYVDGGIVDNYPLWIFNDLDKLYTGRLNEVLRDDISENTLGVKLLSTGKTNSEEVYSDRKNLPNIFTFASEIINTMMYQIERIDMADSWIRHTIAIQTGNVYFLNFNLTSKTIDELIENGELGVTHFFDEHDPLQIL
jgi:predicted acylesterase/phospholipase RssA